MHDVGREPELERGVASEVLVREEEDLCRVAVLFERPRHDGAGVARRTDGAAVAAERVFQVLGFLQQVPRPGDQRLAIVGQAELAGGAMQQADTEMVLELRHLAGDAANFVEIVGGRDLDERNSNLFQKGADGGG